MQDQERLLVGTADSTFTVVEYRGSINPPAPIASLGLREKLGQNPLTRLIVSDLAQPSKRSFISNYRIR